RLASSFNSRTPSSVPWPAGNLTPRTVFSPPSCAQSWNSKPPPCCGRLMLHPVKIRATSITSCWVSPPSPPSLCSSRSSRASLSEEQVEVMGTDVDHDFVQLAPGERGTHHRELLHLPGEPAAHLLLLAALLPWRGQAVHRGLSGALPLALPPLLARRGVEAGEVARVVAQDAERGGTLGHQPIVELVGGKLAVDPVHHAARRHRVYLSGSGAVGEAVEGMQCGVVGRHLGGEPDSRT